MSPSKSRVSRPRHGAPATEMGLGDAAGAAIGFDLDLSEELQDLFVGETAEVGANVHWRVGERPFASRTDS